MENLLNSDILVSYEDRRQVFKPYGLTCERWKPCAMSKFDRHNEIELNFVPKGSLSYFMQDRHIVVPCGRLSLFWGLTPHKVIGAEDADFYYVSTIPLSMFLEWRLPDMFVQDLLAGKVLLEPDDLLSDYDSVLFGNWISDMSEHRVDIMSVEMKGRLLRLADRYSSFMYDERRMPGMDYGKIEAMAMFIACNFERQIRVVDIAEAAGLNPDYANAVFKKTFGRSLMESVILERVTSAQRKLVTTDDAVLQIAYDSGFNSISSFNVAFRKINGCTPREYRRQNMAKVK